MIVKSQPGPEADLLCHEVELLIKIPVRKRQVTPYFCLIEGLNRQHFYQSDFLQNHSLVVLLFSWVTIIFPQW